MVPQADASIRDVIRRRSSWRSYDGRPLSENDRADLEAFLATLTRGPFGSPVRLELVAAGRDYRAELKSLGTYGVVNGARAFIVGAAKAGPRDMEDYGFAFERAVLRATALGLGTCWLGATFRRSGFAARIDLRADEVLPAVSPVGYVARARTVGDAATRFLARSKQRKPWPELFFDGDGATPLAAAAAGPYAEVLEMVRLAPSASNRQPWRLVRAAGGAYHLFLKRTPGYNSRLVNVPGGDLQRLDMGIAMCHFELAARELGLAGTWGAPAPAASGPDGASHIATWRPG